MVKLEVRGVVVPHFTIETLLSSDSILGRSARLQRWSSDCPAHLRCAHPLGLVLGSIKVVKGYLHVLLILGAIPRGVALKAHNKALAPWGVWWHSSARYMRSWFVHILASHYPGHIPSLFLRCSISLRDLIWLHVIVKVVVVKGQVFIDLVLAVLIDSVFGESILGLSSYREVLWDISLIEHFIFERNLRNQSRVITGSMSWSSISC